MIYKVKNEFADQWTADDVREILVDDEIKRLSREWGVSVFDLMEQVEPDDCVGEISRQGSMFESMGAWYESWYPEDSIGCHVADNAFIDLLDALNNGMDVYDVIGVEDSIVRERLFGHLAELIGVSYDEVYDKWLSV